MADQSFESNWLAFFGLIVIRYFLIAGGTYWLFYQVQQQSPLKRALRRSPPSLGLIQNDIKLSVLSATVFALCGTLILLEYKQGKTLIYNDVSQYGWWYLGVSFVTVLFLQDSYFYFIHRAAHHPRWFKWIHHGHHRSGDPTPWTSFAFDLPEALVQAFFFFVIVFVIPLHFVTLVAVLLTMTLWAVWNHLGFELFPPAFSRHWFTRWLIGPTHHAIHHRKYTVHYGLYFTVWDRLLGTQDPLYDSAFDATLKRSGRELQSKL